MKKLQKSLTQLMPVALWTAGYAFVVWVIMWWLFQFDVFSAGAWGRITSIELHGFPGLVFFVLVLAAVPLYIATTVVMMRTKAIPIKIPIPKCFEPVPQKKEEVKTEPIVKENEAMPPLPAGMPMEMRENFARVKKNSGVRQRSVFNRPEKMNKTQEVVGAVPELVTVPNNSVETSASVMADKSVGYSDMGNGDSGLPLPDDFDFASSSASDVPIFADIDFDSDVKNEEKPSENNKHDKLIDVLSKHKLKAKPYGNLVKCGDFIIAEHNDDSFWVADEIDWFAAGKQKPSPIAELIKARDADGLHPVIYLATNNIMDLDKVTANWTDQGITVVDSIDKLMTVVGG